jgi:hypothetical protein
MIVRMPAMMRTVSIEATVVSRKMSVFLLIIMVKRCIDTVKEG